MVPPLQSCPIAVLPPLPELSYCGCTPTPAVLLQLYPHPRAVVFQFYPLPQSCPVAVVPPAGCPIVALPSPTHTNCPIAVLSISWLPCKSGYSCNTTATHSPTEVTRKGEAESRQACYMKTGLLLPQNRLQHHIQLQTLALPSLSTNHSFLLCKMGITAPISRQRTK